MGLDIDALFEKQAFQALAPERREALKALAGRLEGASGPEAMAVLMEFGRSLPKDAPLSKEDQRAMLEAALEALPAEDREKFRAMAKLLNL